MGKKHFCFFQAAETAYFKKLNVLKISDLNYVQQLKFYFQYINNCLPVYFQNVIIKTGLEIPNYNTRGCTNLRNAIVKQKVLLKCIRNRLPIVINNTPLMILNKTITHSIIGPTLYTKKCCIGKYITVCNINHCHICNMLNQNKFLFCIIVFYFLLLFHNFVIIFSIARSDGPIFPLELNQMFCYILSCRV